MDDIALSSTVACPDAQERYLRAMGLLVGMHPEAAGHGQAGGPQHEEMMRSVSMGAFETAALRLLPHDARLMTSSPGQGRFMASVRLRGQACESTSSGNSFALALISALALSIVDRYHEAAGSLPFQQ